MIQQTNEPVIKHTPAAADAAQKKGLASLKIPTSALRAYTMVLALIVIWLLFTWATGGVFLEARNFSNLMRQTAVTGVLAVGMLQGTLVAYANLRSFIVTLGGLLIWRGVIKGVSRGSTIPVELRSFKFI